MEDEDVLAQGAAWTALYPLTADGTGEQIFAVDFCGDYHTPVVIGRGPMAHVDLGVEERRISKKHVVIEYVEELQLFQLQCLGVNSCRVNGHVETRRCPPTVLEGGDIIEIDGKLLRFHLPPDPVPSPQFQPKRASAETYDDISAKRRRLISQQLYVVFTRVVVTCANVTAPG